MNSGQLKTVLRDLFLVDAHSLTKVSGQPFTIAEIEAAIEGSMMPARRVECDLRTCGAA
jgi:2-oxoglutarate ferredoxin oxidoreductase subunit alpha